MRTQFDFYGYCSPTSGKYTVGQDEYFYGEDYRNEKRYKEYMDVGFTMLLLQHENSYSGEEFETSACNQCMTEAVKAGIDRIIVSDTRLKALCDEKILVGAQGRFATETELEGYIEACVAPYIHKAGFYGLQLRDEPEWQHIPAYGQVCRTLKKLYPDIYLQTNLMCVVEAHRTSPTKTDVFEAYEEYVNSFTDASGQDSVLFDEYPFRRGYIIGGYSLRNFQIIAKICKERNIEFRAVMQAFSWLNNGRIVHRRITEQDMYWQLNLAMGCGCKEYSFFTYFTKPMVTIQERVCNTDGVDGAAFINRDGSRTAMYYYTQRIIGEMKKFAPVILKYRYDQSYLFFEKGKTRADFMQTEFALDEQGCPIQVGVSKGVAFVTHLKKKGGDMFMVENLSNVKDEFESGERMQAEITLPTSANTVRYYYRGEEKTAELIRGKFSVQLACGDAIFIEL